MRHRPEDIRIIKRIVNPEGYVLDELYYRETGKQRKWGDYVRITDADIDSIRDAG